MSKLAVGRAAVCYLVLAGLLLLVRGGGGQAKNPAAADLETLKSRLALAVETDPRTGLRTSRGTFAVYEDREAGSGRVIHLNVVILHAKGPDARPDPLFPFAGGPGEDAATWENDYKGHWARASRDIVLVSQRGSGGDNRLDCPKAADDADIQGYLGPLFREDIFRDCLRDLSARFDLAKYSTNLAADDFDDLRRALGYGKINVSGGSYGTRMALVYMRRHSEAVRAAFLNGVAPIAFRNPLYHALDFHEAVRALFAECSNDPECRAAFPRLEDEYLTVLDRLEREPAEVEVTHPVSKSTVRVRFSREAFTEGLRVVMYSGARNRGVPFLIHRAFEGDLRPFAEAALASSRGIRKSLALGLLLSVTCAEDLDRITEEDIVKYASRTDAGDGRVRTQKAMCGFWPRSTIEAGYGEPVSVDIPTLLLSGNLDPATSPRWGEEAASHLPRSLHLVVPGGHGVGGNCVTAVEKAFLETGSIDGLDISCVKALKPGKFRTK